MTRISTACHGHAMLCNGMAKAMPCHGHAMAWPWPTQTGHGCRSRVAMIQKVNTAESTIDWLIFRGRIAEGFADGSRRRAERVASCMLAAGVAAAAAAAAATAATATKGKTPQGEKTSLFVTRGRIAEGCPPYLRASTSPRGNLKDRGSSAEGSLVFQLGAPMCEFSLRIH